MLVFFRRGTKANACKAFLFLCSKCSGLLNELGGTVPRLENDHLRFLSMPYYRYRWCRVSIDIHLQHVSSRSPSPLGPRMPLEVRGLSCRTVHGFTPSPRGSDRASANDQA